MTGKNKILIENIAFDVPAWLDNHDFERWKEISDGLWEPQTFKILNKFVSHNDFVFEVGVDAAQTTLFTAVIAGGVLALDPIPGSIEYLRSCIDINPSFKEKVVPVHGALSNRRGKTIFAKGSELFDDVHFSATNHNVIVETYLVKDIEDIFQAEITFINMDIEGGEYICLPSMVKWLEERKPKLLLSLHPGFLIKKSSKINLIPYGTRLLRQIKLFACLKSFPYIYDVSTCKQIPPSALFSIKFLRGKAGKDLQILCSFTELDMDEGNNPDN